MLNPCTKAPQIDEGDAPTLRRFAQEEGKGMESPRMSVAEAAKVLSVSEGTIRYRINKKGMYKATKMDTPQGEAFVLNRAEVYRVHPALTGRQSFDGAAQVLEEGVPVGEDYATRYGTDESSTNTNDSGSLVAGQVNPAMFLALLREDVHANMGALIQQSTTSHDKERDALERLADALARAARAEALYEQEVAINKAATQRAEEAERREREAREVLYAVPQQTRQQPRTFTGRMVATLMR